MELKTGLKIFGTIIFTPIFLLIILMLGITIILPLLTYRAFISVLAGCFKSGQLRKLVSPISHIMGAEDMFGINSFTSFAAVELSVASPDVDIISSLVANNGLEAVDAATGAPLYPELKETVKSWMGFLFWSPALNFDIRNHVYSLKDLNLTLQEPDWKSYPNALQDCVLSLVREKKWVQGMPFWEIIIIPRIPRNLLSSESKDVSELGSILLFRMHHVLGDGFCIFKFLTRIFGLITAVETVAKPNFHAIAKSGGCQYAFQKLLFILRIPYDILWELLRSANKPGIIPKMNGDNGKELRLVGVISDDISVSKIKDAKHLHDVEFTSVLLAMFAGGSRRFISKIGGGSENLPQEVEIMFPLPMPGHPDTLTNHISQGSLRVPISEPDCSKRLLKIHHRVMQLKKSTLPYVTFVLLKLIGSFPTVLTRWLRMMNNGPSLIFTNLLGPAEVVQLGGTFPVLGLRVGTNAPQDSPAGYCLMMITYNGNARLTIGSMSNYLSTQEDAQELLRSCIEELDILARDESV